MLTLTLCSRIREKKNIFLARLQVIKLRKMQHFCNAVQHVCCVRVCLVDPQSVTLKIMMHLRRDPRHNYQILFWLTNYYNTPH